MNAAERYVWKEIPRSSHDLLRKRIWQLAPGLRLLDLGAAGGHLGRAVRERCAYLAGVEEDPLVPAPARETYDDWRVGDALLVAGWNEPFDVIVCADILEHLASPEKLLARIREWLRPRGLLLASLPNIANISVRLALLAGRFPYANRGLLDRTHLRFYTRSSARRLLEKGGFVVRSIDATAMPYELALPALARPPLAGMTRAFASLTSRAWPTMFGYQFVLEAAKP